MGIGKERVKTDRNSKKLTSQGKIPHDEELQKHPEKSMEGKMWLMGDVSALIKVCQDARARPAELIISGRQTSKGDYGRDDQRGEAVFGEGK
jgi:hypothetical protein